MSKTNALTTFNNPQFGTIRVFTKDNEPWLVAKDVCTILGLKNTAQSIVKLDDVEKTIIRNDSETGRRAPYLSLISESGFYKLVMRSDKEIAKPFQNWVTRDVLPAIRKDGMYVMGEEKVKTGELEEAEFVLKAMTMLKAKVETLKAEKAAVEAAKDAAEAKVLELAPKASKYDTYLDSTGVINLTGAGKLLGMSAKLLGALLRREGWLFKRTDQVTPTQPIIDCGFMVVKHTVNPYNGKVAPHGYLTVKGMDKLIELYGEVA